MQCFGDAPRQLAGAVDPGGIEEVVAAIRKLDELRKTLPYATDGAVIKLDDFGDQLTAGYRGEGKSARKLSPRWACAYKFAPERAETRTRLPSISWIRTRVGRWSLGSMSDTLDRLTGPGRSMTPPGSLGGRGLVCRFIMLGPSTSTRCSRSRGPRR